MNTVYDLKNLSQLLRWLTGASICILVGHDWTGFPIYRTDERGYQTVDQCLICARCQRLEVVREGEG